MADIISHRVPPNQDVRNDGIQWSLIVGIAASVLALTYAFAALHARYVTGSQISRPSQSAWFPLELFVIAVSPALAGFIFLWSERHLQSKSAQRSLRNLGIFGFGLILAAWVALVAK